VLCRFKDALRVGSSGIEVHLNPGNVSPTESVRQCRSIAEHSNIARLLVTAAVIVAGRTFELLEIFQAFRICLDPSWGFVANFCAICAAAGFELQGWLKQFQRRIVLRLPDCRCNAFDLSSALGPQKKLDRTFNLSTCRVMRP
jgi:hypothetical protein